MRHIQCAKHLKASVLKGQRKKRTPSQHMMLALVLPLGEVLAQLIGVAAPGHSIPPVVLHTNRSANEPD